MNATLKKEYEFLQIKNADLLKSIELVLLSVNKSVKIENESLKEFITGHEDSSSLLFINENSCAPCLDVLLYEMEELRTGSKLNFENLKLIILGKNTPYKNSGFISFFDDNFNGHLSINENDIEFFDNILLPEIFFVNINNQLRIKYLIQFESNNPDFFSLCLKTIN